MYINRTIPILMNCQKKEITYDISAFTFTHFTYFRVYNVCNYAHSQLTLTNVWRLYLVHASESEVLLHKYCRVLMVISSKRVQNSKNFVSQISTIHN